jgi:UDP-glucose 4-epimerase
MNVLVTGGAGYIGSHTVDALRRTAFKPIVMDNLQLGNAEAVGTSPLIVADIADDHAVTSAVRQYETTSVIHFAAYKNVGESMADPGRYFRNNVAGTLALVNRLVEEGVKHFVFSSSCSVVGTPQIVPVTEDAPLSPESVYAETKAMIERVLHWYSKTKDLRFVSLRYFNAAGASSDGSNGEDWRFSQNLVPLAMKSVLLGEPTLSVFGNDYPTADGTCVRDYIHVEDLAVAHVKALEYLEGGGESTVVNVGTGVGSSVLDVLGTIERVAGKPVPHQVVGRRHGDPVAVYADPSRAHEVLGWEAEHGLEYIIETAYRWHASQVEQSLMRPKSS